MAAFNRVAQALLVSLLAASCAQPLGTASQSSPGNVASAYARLNVAGARISDERVQLEMVKALYPGDPDYFPKNKSFVEYVVRVRNIGKAPITVANFVLVDQSGVYVGPTMSAEALMNLPNNSADMATNTALYTAAAILDTQMPMPFLGFLTTSSMADANARAADEAPRYYEAFQRRALRSALLDPNGQIQGSVFFPVSAAPQRFILVYEAGGKKHGVYLQRRARP